MEESELIAAEKAALRLVARAEQCTSGLSRKLKKKNYDPSCIDKVIEMLCAKNLVNDRRFAQLWIESRFRLLRSPRRLLSSLCARGIDRDDAQAAINAVLSEEAESAALERYVKRYLRGKKDESVKSLKYILKNEGFSQRAIGVFLDDN